MSTLPCHICGSKEIKYAHTIHDVDRPWVMVNVAYCEVCAKMMGKIEYTLSKHLLERKEVKE